MEFIFFFLIFLALCFGLILLISIPQLQESRTIEKRFEIFNLKKIDVQFNQQTTGIGNITGGVPIKAILYFNEDILFIRPKKNGIFNGIFNKNLPLVFCKNQHSQIQTGLLKSHIPDSFSFSKWKSILIKYTKANIKYSIQIQPIDLDHTDEISVLENW
jgi:hypothetical protein